MTSDNSIEIDKHMARELRWYPRSGLAHFTHSSFYWISIRKN